MSVIADSSQPDLKGPDVLMCDPQKIHPPPSEEDVRSGRDAITIERIAANLLKMGMLQPLRVIRRADGELVVGSGETRRQAAIRAGIKLVPVIVIDRPMTKSELLMERLVENELRGGLSSLERRKAYSRLIELNGWTLTQLGKELHVSQGQISKILSLDKLQDTLLRALEDGSLPFGTATELAKLHPAPDAQLEIGGRAIRGEYSRQDVELIVKNFLKNRGGQMRLVVAKTPRGSVVRMCGASWDDVMSEMELILIKMRFGKKSGLPVATLSDLLKSESD